MRIKTIRSLVSARNMEFVRDKGGLFWYIFFPFFMIFGFAFAFSGGEDAALTVGVWPQNAENAILSDIDMPSISTIEFSDRNRAVEQVRTHQVDLLIDTVNKVYIKNALSEKSALAEQIVLSKTSIPLQAENISGQSLRYIDWLLPGVIGMNMMFSCLFGVGWVVVRYRKNGFLKRLKATPTSALEFVIAQMLSRLIIVMCMSVLVFVGSNIVFRFIMNGSYIDLLVTAILSSTCLISLGLVFAARFQNEELAGGLMNLVTWPMMIFSGVFFSLERVPEVMRSAAQILPLTHFLNASRAIMLDGATLFDVMPNILTLFLMTIGFLLFAALLFKWE